MRRLGIPARRWQAALGLMLVACGGGLAPEDVVGTYRLSTVNGEPLPYTPSGPDAGRATITASVLTLRGDMTGELVREYAGQDFPSVLTISTWGFIEDDIIRLVLEAGIIVQGQDATVKGNTLTIDFDAGDLNPGGLYVYAR